MVDHLIETQSTSSPHEDFNSLKIRLMEELLRTHLKHEGPVASWLENLSALREKGLDAGITPDRRKFGLLDTFEEILKADSPSAMLIIYRKNDSQGLLRSLNCAPILSFIAWCAQERGETDIVADIHSIFVEINSAPVRGSGRLTVLARENNKTRSR